MAKINPVKVKQDADKLEKAGKFDQAIALYKQIVDDNPRDWNTINKIGDLYARLNRTREAADEYAKVADFYERDGFLVRAIAIWKKVNKLDSSSVDPYLKLADLYAKQGLMMEAKSNYQMVVDELIKRGRNREAGDALRKLAELDPADLKVRSRLAELFIREGNTARAVEEHAAIAEELIKKGHSAEAAQVLEKGLRVDAKSVKLRVELGRCYLLQRNYDRAIAYLEEAVQRQPAAVPVLALLGDAYLGSRRVDEAEALFRRIVELDPNDPENRVRMGRVHLMQGDFDRAFAEFGPAVDRLLERREAERALGLLQLVLQGNPTHAPTLRKLGDVYRAQRRDDLATATYSRLAEALLSQDRFADAASMLELLVSLEPHNQQHRTKLQFVRTRMSAGGGVTTERSEIIEEEFEIQEPEPVPAPPKKPAPPPARPAGPSPSPRPEASSARPTPVFPRPVIEPSAPLTDEDKEFIDEHLAEGRVFRKYGLIDKAGDQFEAIVARFPDHVDSRSELKELYKEKGQFEKAAQHALALAEIHRIKGDAAAAEAHEAEALRLVPAIASMPAAALPKPAPHAMPHAAPVAAPEEEEEEVSVEPEPEDEITMDVEEAGIDVGAPAVPVAVEEDLPALEFSDESADAELPAQFIEEEVDVATSAFGPVDAPAAAPEPIPPPPAAVANEEPAPFAIEEEEAAGIFEPSEPELPIPPPPVERAPVERAPRKAPAALPPDIQRVLDEVDSYVSLGFIEDAREALRELDARFPNHPAIAAKLASLGIELEAEAEWVDEAPVDELAGQEPPVDAAAGPLDVLAPSPLPAFAGALDAAGSPPAAEAAAGGIDLGVELGEMFGAQSAVETAAESGTNDLLGEAGLADIFKEFKKGVDKQLSQEDYDTRYNLGIAYKEMGLVDEAIGEFQLAAKDDSRLLECASMLGICFMEKGMPKLAIKWFERGMRVPGRRDEEYMGLRYDLARAWEADGDQEKAYSIFQELYGQDAAFRDVATKVRELGAALG